MKLYAICWQDMAEPWGWAPATEDVPGDALPDGPFFWDREEAEAALTAVRAAAALDYEPLVRDRDRERRERQAKEWRDFNCGKVRPGVSIHVVGEATRMTGTPPEPLMSDEQIAANAAVSVEPEWSIQIYDLPEREGR